MNWPHLKTFFWLRWRLNANQNKRQGMLVIIIGYLLLAFFGLGTLAALAAGFLLGNLKMAFLQPHVFMYIWDGLVIGYLTFWLVGLLGELQRSDILSLDRFLHLPVTPKGAFLINYLGSSTSLTLVMSMSFAGGITLGLLVSAGVEMLMLLFLVAGFFLMITALTYQFRGWLTSMMTTPKRRQAAIGILSMVFLLFFLLFPLIGAFKNASERQGSVESPAVEMMRGRGSPQPPVTEGDRSLLQARFKLANTVFPPGWLPLGAVSTLEGRIIPALASLLGMIVIGSWSLMRSYRTTIRMYKGEFDSRPASVQSEQSKTAISPGAAGKPASFLEIRLPWITEQASAITLAGLRDRLRSNQVRFMFILPVMMLIFIGVILINRGSSQSEFIRVLITGGFSAFIMFATMTYVVGNMFAYDRGGFQVFLLSSATRRDVLLGRNLSMFPLALTLVLLSIIVLDRLNPIRIDHMLALVLQTVPQYLFLCMYGNLLSIFLPMIVRSGGMPASGQNVNILVRELSGLLMLAVLALTFIPLGIEFLMYLLDWHTWFPAYFFFMIVETGIVSWLYSIILDKQAEQLYGREHKILEVVTTRTD